jgi:hypothetical protein
MTRRQQSEYNWNETVKNQQIIGMTLIYNKTIRVFIVELQLQLLLS